MKFYTKCAKCFYLNKSDEFKDRLVEITCSLTQSRTHTYVKCVKCMRCRHCGRILFSRMGDYKKLCKDAEGYFKENFGSDFNKLIGIKISSN